jgi:hypothetical protein
LDIPSAAVASSSAVPPSRKMPTAAPPAPAANLLDFDEPSPAPTSAPVDAPPPPPPVPTEAPPAPPVGGDMFGGMTVKPAAATVAPTEVATTSGSDLLCAVASTPAAASGTESGLFDGVAMKTSAATASVGKENVENSSDETPAAGSGFSFMNSGAEKPQASETSKKEIFDPLLSLDTSISTPTNKMHLSAGMGGNGMAMTPQMAAVMQQQQQQILMMQAQMQQMQMSGVANNSARFMMMQQQGKPLNSNGSMGVPNQGMPMKQNIMGAMNGSGVATSFAFMEDPSKQRQDASNKKFDFVQDAMKTAR